MPRSQPPFADDSDSDTEMAAPRQPQNGRRKRLSEVTPYQDDDDSDSGAPRQPLRTVNINDDVAEKRRRRKSTKVLTMSHSMDVVTEPEPDTSRTPGARPRQQLNTVPVPAPLDEIPINVQSHKFEEWMKLTTDNVNGSFFVLTSGISTHT
jgi:condensin complex subunit 2